MENPPPLILIVLPLTFLCPESGPGKVMCISDTLQQLRPETKDLISLEDGKEVVLGGEGGRGGCNTRAGQMEEAPEHGPQQDSVPGAPFRPLSRCRNLPLGGRHFE